MTPRADERELGIFDSKNELILDVRMKGGQTNYGWRAWWRPQNSGRRSMASWLGGKSDASRGKPVRMVAESPFDRTAVCSRVHVSELPCVRVHLEILRRVFLGTAFSGKLREQSDPVGIRRSSSGTRDRKSLGARFALDQ